MKKIVFTALVSSLLIWTACNIIQPQLKRPYIECAPSFEEDCIQSKWNIRHPSTARVYVLDQGEETNHLLLTNPHEPDVLNPTPIVMETFVKNVEPLMAYQISCDIKVKGYPDVVRNSNSFGFYAFNDDDWFGDVYFHTDSGVYQNTDWMNLKINLISGMEEIMKFEMFNVYDSVWVRNLRITLR